MSTQPSQPIKTCSQRDLVWAHVVGSTTPEESKGLLEHLDLGCAACGAELAHAREATARVDEAVARRTLGQGHSAQPSEDLRERLMSGLSRPQPTAFARHVEREARESLRPSGLPGISIGGGAIAYEDQEGWQPTEVKGVELRTLHHDLQRRTATALVRMAPGSSYPRHRHGGREECLVLTGDLCFEEHRLTAGDYQVAEEGSVHPAQHTEGGCTLLIVSSLDDQPL